MNTSWYSWARIAAGILGAAGWLRWPTIERWLQPKPRTEERAESGADPKFVGELKALRKAPVDPNLISDTESDLDWMQAWHDFEHGMQVEIDKAFAPYLPVPECEDFDEVRELVTPC